MQNFQGRPHQSSMEPTHNRQRSLSHSQVPQHPIPLPSPFHSQSAPTSRPSSNKGRSITKRLDALPKGAACVSCKRRKVRCDGAKPACGTCIRSAKYFDMPVVQCKYAPSRKIRTSSVSSDDSGLSSPSSSTYSYKDWSHDLVEGTSDANRVYPGQIDMEAIVAAAAASRADYSLASDEVEHISVPTLDLNPMHVSRSAALSRTLTSPLPTDGPKTPNSPHTPLFAFYPDLPQQHYAEPYSPIRDIVPPVPDAYSSQPYAVTSAQQTNRQQPYPVYSPPPPEFTEQRYPQGYLAPPYQANDIVYTNQPYPAEPYNPQYPPPPLVGYSRQAASVQASYTPSVASHQAPYTPPGAPLPQQIARSQYPVPPRPNVMGQYSEQAAYSYRPGFEPDYTAPGPSTYNNQLTQSTPSMAYGPGSLDEVETLSFDASYSAPHQPQVVRQSPTSSSPIYLDGYAPSPSPTWPRDDAYHTDMSSAPTMPPTFANLATMENGRSPGRVSSISEWLKTSHRNY